MPGRTLTRKLIDAHLVDGDPTPGEEIALRIDQTLTQDATGTLVMLELEAIGLDRARTERQRAVRRPQPAAGRRTQRRGPRVPPLRRRRFGLWFSKPGNGVSHPTHMQRFGMPGKTLVGLRLAHLRRRVAGHARDRRRRPRGRDGHRRRAAATCAMPEIWGVRLTGELPDVGDAPRTSSWRCCAATASTGGVNRIIEYHGPGPARRSPRWTGT